MRLSAILFTEHCAACQKTVSIFNERGFCEDCEREITFFKSPVFENGKGDVLISPAAYSGAWRRAILNFKFRGDRSAGFYLAKRLAFAISENIKADIDGVLFVPVFSLKNGRKYNQSEYLARKTAKILKFPVYPYLKKKKDIKSQTACKTSAERTENVEGAYGVRREAKKLVSGKTFLIIDDVETTGATLFECGKALLRCGAEKVYYASAARTVLSAGSFVRLLRPGDGAFGAVTFKKRWKKPADLEKAARVRIMKNEIFRAVKKLV